MINADTLKKLQSIPEKEWGFIYKELVLYADFKLKNFGFEVRTEKDSVDAQSFASLAIEHLFDGTRKWDYEKFPDVLIHLKLIVKSLLSSHFKSSSKSIVTIQKQYQVEQGIEVESEIITLVDSNLEILDDSPEEIIINNERWTEIEHSFGKNEDGFVIFSDWLDGNSPRDIATAYNFNIKDVYNAIRNGKRYIKLLYNKK